MLASLLLSLREGLEAALIIGIVLGVLQKINRPDLKKAVWSGSISAVVLSFIGAILLNILGMEFEGRGEQIFEGITMLLAAGILTWMIIWMHSSAVHLKHDLERKAHNAIRGNSGKALYALAFLAVFREGIELALFLLAVRQTSTPLQVISGAILGLSSAILLGWIVFTSTRKLSLKGFFQVTNVLLILFAAGLVAYGVHEFNEAGLIPAVIDPIWNINHIISDKSEFGLVLKALFGYNGNPSLTEVAAYCVYFIGIVTYVVKRKQPNYETFASVSSTG